VPVLFLIAVVAVLAGVFLAATGRGGELAYERVDHAPLDLGPVSAPDIAMLRPPTAMWGYNMQVTDEALDLVARAMRDRDVTIAYLQQQLANRVAADPGPPQVRQPAGNPAASEALQAGNPDAPQSSGAARAPGVLVAPLPQRTPQPPAADPFQEAAQPAQATEPSPTFPGSYDVQGPQGAYDTHDWWAEQEEAAREEEARRQAAAQQASQARPDESGPLESGPLESSPLEAGPLEAGPLESGRTGTVPNPVITYPGGTDTSSAHGHPPATSSAPPVPPDDDTTVEAEEQGW
jgi:hypothetical protein